MSRTSNAPLPKNKRMLHQLNRTTLGSVRELIFGLEDGMVSTLGVIVGIAAGTQSKAAVILSGCVVIAVEALSMAAGDYLSNKTEKELENKLISEERKEIAVSPEEEKREALAILKRRGYGATERFAVVRSLLKTRKRMLDFMVHNELGISHPNSHTSILVSTTVMGGAYIVGGSIALSSYLLLPLQFASVAAVSFVAVALFLLGAVKGRLLSVSWLRSGIEMMGVSLGAALVGHFVGWLARQFIV